MVSVRIPEPEDHDVLVAALYEAGTVGIVEGEGYVEAFFEDAQAAAAFGEPHETENVDWVEKTKEAWPPLLIGQRLFVVAPWRSDPTPEGRFRLEINPGMQCGTGQHPCTQLCLEAMDFLIYPGASVLDVGSGSGILAKAAKLLGAERVVACDIDPGAAEAATVPFFVGSVNAVRANSFDFVIANINQEVIDALKPDLERVARRRILSGFKNDDGDWTCVVT